MKKKRKSFLEKEVEIPEWYVKYIAPTIAVKTPLSKDFHFFDVKGKRWETIMKTRHKHIAKLVEDYWDIIGFDTRIVKSNDKYYVRIKDFITKPKSLQKKRKRRQLEVVT